jgi:hypothetical protein
MLDEEGFDPGIIAGVGLAMASAAVLLLAFALFKTTAPANTAISLEAAASEVSGDLETVGSMAIPYSASRYYGFDGIDVSVSEDRVTATMGQISFSRPLTIRIEPGKYAENGTLLWNDTRGYRQYLNNSLNATGTSDDPLEPEGSGRLHELMKKAGAGTLLSPIEVVPGQPLAIEKLFVHVAGNETRAPEVNAYVFVYPG